MNHIHIINYYDTMMPNRVTIPVIDPIKITDQFYTVLSVELGNTTIKAILMTTNIKTNQSYMVNKLVRLTRDIRQPKTDEELFGYTIWEKPLTYESIKSAITSIILDCLDNVGLSVGDVDFVVRSTGIVALSKLSSDVGTIIKALSDGCLEAGIKPSKMVAPFSKNNIPEHIRKYSFLSTVEFDGSVVSVRPPKKSGVSSNQMEGELVTAGIKLAAKNSPVDYRNPVISIDMGTTLAGQVVDNTKPYANLLCNYVGLAGGISDIILRGSNIIDEKSSTINLENPDINAEYNDKLISTNTIKLHEYIDIMEVPPNLDEFGSVGINPSTDNIKLIGSRINNEDKLIDKFINISNDYTTPDVFAQIDDLYAYLIKRLIDTTKTLNIISDDMTLGITGRAGITGHKPELICKYLNDDFSNVIFVDDGLALGSVMMARCMNSLGSPTNPIGGSRGGMCIMQQRIK
ncbi:MAG: methanogenesis marker 14 protein [Methanosphaera sp.]|nr:methanogenesis marker 14 protein [Methanosphaera sp.]